jgi:hypothetical protein
MHNCPNGIPMADISWAPFNLPVFNAIRGSTQTYELPRPAWPQWARDSTRM